MNAKRTELKVGLFVVVCLVLLALLIINFSKGFSLVRRTYQIKLQTVNVGGIKPDASVLMAGVPVGNVSKADLSPDGRTVIMTLRILERYKIRKDAVFIIDQAGFLGDEYVAINPTGDTAPFIADGETVVCDAPFNLQNAARSTMGFIARIDQTAQKLDAAISRVDRLVLNEKTLTNLSSAIVTFREASERVEGTLASLNNLVLTNGVPIHDSLSNFVVLSAKLNRFGDQMNGVVATNSQPLNEAIRNFNQSSVRLNSLLEDVQSGKGVAGSLFKDDQLRTNIADLAIQLGMTASNLSVTTSNINKRGLWGILWKPKEVKETTGTPSRSPARDSRK